MWVQMMNHNDVDAIAPRIRQASSRAPALSRRPRSLPEPRESGIPSSRKRQSVPSTHGQQVEYSTRRAWRWYRCVTVRRKKKRNHFWSKLPYHHVFSVDPVDPVHLTSVHRHDHPGFPLGAQHRAGHGGAASKRDEDDVVGRGGL